MLSHRFSLRILFFVLTFFCFFNTSSQFLGKEKYKNFTNNDFSEKFDLISESFDVGTEKLISPLRITSLNDYLLIQDIGAKKHIHIIDITKKKYVGSYIGIGNKPNEMSSVSVFEENDKNSFIILDNIDKKYHLYDIQDLINSPDNFITGTLNEKGYVYFLNYDKNNQRLWFAGQFNKNYRIYEKHISSGELNQYGELLSATTDKINTSKVRNHLSAAKISKNNGYIVFAYEGVSLLEVFNQNTKEFVSAFVPHNKPPIYRVVEEDGEVQIGYTQDSLYEFLDIKLTDQYIYAVYRGQEFINTDPKKSSVYVFDYNLNPIRLYNLDKEITSITIYNDKIMYGLNISPLIPGQRGKIVKYDLKNN